MDYSLTGGNLITITGLQKPCLGSDIFSIKNMKEILNVVVVVIIIVNYCIIIVVVVDNKWI